MLPEELTQSLGKLSKIMEENVLPKKNYKGLFDYTHDKSSVFSNTIAEKYLTVDGENKNPFDYLTDISKEDYPAWSKAQYKGKNYYTSIKNNEGENTSKSYYVNKNTHSYIEFDNFDYNLESNLEKERIKRNIEIEQERQRPKKPKAPKQKDYETFEHFKVDKEKYEKDLEKYKKSLKEWRGRKRNLKLYESELENIDIKPINLLQKTNDLFRIGRTNDDGSIELNETIISAYFNNEDNVKSYVDSAISENLGRSKGRSLLKKKATINDDNPFCRVWTYHNQYDSFSKTLRRFKVFDKDIYSLNPLVLEGMMDNSVLKNSLVKITPDKRNPSIRNCMFSIENLAWKDVNLNLNLTPDQIGPNGGRIMWFPPYNLRFNENVSSDWNETVFIGRGEPIYTYSNTRRTGTLNFTLLIDHPSVINFKETNNDESILRFFTGDEIIHNREKENNEENNEESNEEQINNGIDLENTSNISFSIFFPRYYSGYFNNNNKKDSDLITYLVFGNNCGISAPDDGFDSGYEVSNDGITNFNNNKTTKTITINGESHILYHRIDYAYRQDIFEKLDEVVDSDSSGLNKNPYVGKNSSFLDFFCFLETQIIKSRSEFLKNIDVINENGNVKNGLFNNINEIGDVYMEIIGYYTDDEDVAISTSRVSCVASYIINNIYKKNGVVKYYSTKHLKTENNGKVSERVDVKIYYNMPDEFLEIVGENAAISVGEVVIQAKRTPPTYNEADYFNDLQEKNHFLYESIVEKVKYFEPLYHSITPEGFNSRLTFLQQCMRQGHTKDWDITNNNIAYNTSFGRPPFCILRIGDFINTKMLIKGMTITYENSNGIQWDLNEEGVGVQPMFANISLNIELIGGQSLETPIRRLNNAITFNYYANTSVYDKRSDRAISNEEGEIINYIYNPE